MKERVNRIFVRKKPEYAVESHLLLQDLKLSLHLENLDDVKIINRYDIQGISDEEYEISKKTKFLPLNIYQVNMIKGQILHHSVFRFLLRRKIF